MLFDEKELVYNGIFKKDYKNFIDEIMQIETITETIDSVETTRPVNENEAFTLFVTKNNLKAINDIVCIITQEEYTKIVDKTTGNTSLEKDIAEAELQLTTFYIMKARLMAMEDFLSSQSDGRVSISLKDYSRSLAFVQLKAMSLIKRWFND